MRYVCTKENPWKKGFIPAVHPDAELVDEVYDNSSLHNDYDVYVCPHCGLRFEETIAN